MRKRYNRRNGLYKQYDIITGEGIFDTITGFASNIASMCDVVTYLFRIYI